MDKMFIEVSFSVSNRREPGTIDKIKCFSLPDWLQAVDHKELAKAAELFVKARYDDAAIQRVNLVVKTTTYTRLK